jgi:excisionase family DNA binding protein
MQERARGVSEREVMDAREADPFADRRRRYFSVSEVKDYLGLSRSKVYQLVEGGDLPACRFGGSIRISRADIERFEEHARH